LQKASIACSRISTFSCAMVRLALKLDVAPGAVLAGGLQYQRRGGTVLHGHAN
jgi:hypothetical protein